MSQSVQDCIAAALGSGKLNQEEHDRLLKLLAEARKGGLSADASYEMAAGKLSGMISKSADRQAKNLGKLTSAARTAEAYPQNLSMDSIKQFNSAGYHTKDRMIPAWTRGRLIRANWEERAKDALKFLEPNGLIIPEWRTANENEFVRAAYAAIKGQGEATAEAKAAYQSYAEADRFYIGKFNAEGGNIPTLERRILPNPDWDAGLVRDGKKFSELIGQGKTFDEAHAALRDAWINDVAGRVTMYDNETGDILDEAERRSALMASFDSLSTNGANKLKDSTATWYGANRFGSDSRKLHINSAEDWIYLNGKYGKGGVFNSLYSDISNLSRDLGVLEVKGTNPQGFDAYMLNQLMYRRSIAGYNSKTLRKSLTFETVSSYEALTREINGGGDSPDHGIANALGFARSTVVAAQIGSAVLTAITDIPRMALADELAGLSRSSTLGNAFKIGISWNDKVIKSFARRLGVVVDLYRGNAILEARAGLGSEANSLVGKLANWVVHKSGLHTFTNSGRYVSQTKFLAEISTYAEHFENFADVPAMTREWLASKGMNQKLWTQIVDSERQFTDFPALHARDGFIDVGSLVSNLKTYDAGMSLQAAMLEHSDVFFPDGNPRVLVGMMYGARKGTAAGEIFRMTRLFMTWPWLILNGTIRRTLNSNLSGAAKMQVLTKWVVATSIMGSFSNQLHSISKGMDPEDMTSADHWRKAILTGGGLSLFGDFVNSALHQNRFDQNIWEAAGGPVVGSLLQGGEVFHEAIKSIRGQPNQFAKRGVDLLQRTTPAGNIWYSRLVTDRLFFDSLRELLDPQANVHFMQQKIRLRERTGQHYFSAPGSAAPGGPGSMGDTRFPDFGKAIGE